MTFPAPSRTSTLIVFDHSTRPVTVPENAPPVFEVVVLFFSVPIRKLTVLVAFVIPDTITVGLLTVVSATGSLIVTVAVSVGPPLPAVMLIGFVTSTNVSLSVTVIS